MKNPKTKIAVIILNFNGKDNTIACLKSLSQVVIKNFVLEIFVVDNNSSDDSCTAIRLTMNELFAASKSKKLLSYTLIVNNDNLGFCEGNNVGIRQAFKNKADYLFILNNDTLVDKMVISALLKTARRYKRVGIIGPKIYFAPRFEYHFKRYQDSERGKVIWYAGGVIDQNNIVFSHRGVDEIDSGQFNKSELTDFVSGCAMLIRREVIEKIGMFDPKYYLYLEDVDLCERARKAGFKLWYEPKAFLWHKNASSSGKPGSPLHVYYQTRNRLLFGFKYGSWRTKFALGRESIKQLITDGNRRKAILDFYLGRLGKRYP